MSSRISRRDALRLSAVAGAAGLAAPLLADRASAASAASPPAVAGTSAATTSATTSASAVRARLAEADRAADRIVTAIRRPLIPRRDLRLADFGGVGDGVTDNSAAFAAAIRAANRRGGGRVVVPAGDYATGPSTCCPTSSCTSRPAPRSCSAPTRTPTCPSSTPAGRASSA